MEEFKAEVLTSLNLSKMTELDWKSYRKIRIVWLLKFLKDIW